MKRLLFTLLTIGSLFSCSGGNYNKAEDALDATREFVDACLKGEFDKATFYMLKDDENKKQLEKIQEAYDKKSTADREQYREASINILEEDAVSDTAHIINYKNSFDNVARKARVIQRNGEWLVDLKATFDGNL